MRSPLNFVSAGNPQSTEFSGIKPPGPTPLFRQPSLYSLTFDELQNTIGGSIGKDFGSMNMDELLKNICTVEENQFMTSSVGKNETGEPITLSRTLSQMTVDQVWKDVMKDGAAKETGCNLTSQIPQKQQSLGEITIEEFLFRAGVVREAEEQNKILYDDGFFKDISQFNNSNSNSCELQGFQQTGQDSLFFTQPGGGFDPPAFQTPRRRRQIPHQHPLYPKSAKIATSGQSQTIMVNEGVKPDTESQTSPDNILPYGHNRGRRSTGGVEKVIERRQRRMIKNRESAARSRARKQAYTMELEAEVAKLKELNQELEKKQNEIMEIQKCQIREKMVKRQGLKRTLTGPW